MELTNYRYLLNFTLAYRFAIVEFNTLIKVLPNWIRESTIFKNN